MTVLYSNYLEIDDFKETTVRIHPAMKMMNHTDFEFLLSESRTWVNPPRVVKPLYQEKAPLHLGSRL